MPYVKAYVMGEVNHVGRITLIFGQMEVVDGPRPKSFEEVGADEQMCRRIRERIPGEIATLGWLGGATAMLVEINKLMLLDLPLMEKLTQKYGPMGWYMYLAEVRNTGAPYIFNVAEPSGGMAERLNLAAEQMGESVELGFYQPDGWLRFILPPELADCQSFLDEEQEGWWNVVRPGFRQKYKTTVEFLPYGDDDYGGRSGIISAGPAGDISLVSVAKLNLHGTGWRVLDTESRPGKPEKGEPEWVALNRKIVGITPHIGKGPMMYEFSPEGGLDHCGLHVELAGPNIDLKTGLISHLSRAVLGSQCLDWLRREDYHE